MRARRDADEQGRDRRRRRGARGADFYRPAHEQVYNAIMDLYGRGEPADAVTVSDELGKRGELLRHRRCAVPAHPARQRSGRGQRGLLRPDRAREGDPAPAGRGLASGSGRCPTPAEGDVDEIVDRAQAEVYSVTERRAAEDYKPALRADAAHARRDGGDRVPGAGLSGVPTGFADLDELTNGLHPGQMIIIAARPRCGKSTLALWTLPGRHRSRTG